MLFQTDKRNKNYLRTNKTIIFYPKKRKEKRSAMGCREDAPSAEWTVKILPRDGQKIAYLSRSHLIALNFSSSICSKQIHTHISLSVHSKSKKGTKAPFRSSSMAAKSFKYVIVGGGVSAVSFSMICSQTILFFFFIRFHDQIPLLLSL